MRRVTFEVTFNVGDPQSMRSAALTCWSEGGGSEEDFRDNERKEEKIADTPVAVWLMALFDHPRDYGPGFHDAAFFVDSSEFYKQPALPAGFDPATSITAVQIANLMKVALESEFWNDAKPLLPKRFKSLVTGPSWYGDPALYISTRPWYFEITNHEYDGVDAKTGEIQSKEVIYKIGRADILAAVASLADDRPRRIVEIMNDQTDVDLADIFFQTVAFKSYCYYE